MYKSSIFLIKAKKWVYRFHFPVRSVFAQKKKKNCYYLHKENYIFHVHINKPAQREDQLIFLRMFAHSFAQYVKQSYAKNASDTKQ